MQKQKTLSAKFQSYSIVQTIDHHYIAHIIYQNNNKLIVNSGKQIIRRNTVKQLQNYLRYLVNKGIIPSLTKVIETNDKMFDLYPKHFDELTLEIFYDAVEKPVMKKEEENIEYPIPYDFIDD